MLPLGPDIAIAPAWLLAQAHVWPVAPSLLATVLAGILLVLLWRSRKYLRGTTLLGPWRWAIVSVSAIGLVEAADSAGVLDSAAADPWRFMAAVTGFLPAMSLLGAKRPQDQAWHFVVLALWGMLALPAVEALLLRRGQALAIVDARAWFLLVLIGLEVLVLLPTRHWPAALLAGVGQTSLLWSFLPWTESAAGSRWTAAALAAFAVGLAISLRPSNSRRQQPFDRLWLDFRNSYGALWSARVMERVNAAAAMYDWPIRLGWGGFHQAADPSQPAAIPPELASSLRQTLANLLRRFVTPEWIDARLEDEH